MLDGLDWLGPDTTNEDLISMARRVKDGLDLDAEDDLIGWDGAELPDLMELLLRDPGAPGCGRAARGDRGGRPDRR